MTATYYIEPADVEAYFLAFGDVPSVWTTASATERLQAVQVGARWIDQTFGSRWKGRRATSSQTLDHPRVGMIDRDGYAIDGTTTHQAVRYANAEAAVLHLQGKLTTLGDIEETARIKSKRIAGPGGSKSVEYLGGKSETAGAQRRFPKIEALLRDVLTGSGGLVEHQVVLG